ncbi:MAG: ABC transporter substrate-binding protein [Acidimicrobiales bacterium]
MKKSLRFVVALVLSAVAFPLINLASASASASASQSPQCIVSLSPSATETLYAIGAGAQVQAVDQDSNYPAQAKRLAARHMINPLTPSVEGLLSICAVTASHPSSKPDLVVISFDANSIQQDLTAQGVKVVMQDAPTSLNGALAQIRQLGQLTGHAARADALAASMQRRIAADIASVPAHPSKKISVYYEVSTNPYYSLTSSTFVGTLLKSVGLVNIADADATTADAGYPQLNAEYIASANPSLIFLAGDASVASVAARPGFSRISAVVHRNVIGVSADVASRWGPRLTVLMNEIASSVKRVLNEKNLWIK